MGKKSSGMVIALVIFVMLSLCLGGYIAYDKFMSKSQEDNINNTSNQPVKKDDSNKVTISVVEAANYTEKYFNLFKFRLPKITGNTNTINLLNSSILNEVLSNTYFFVAAHTEDEENFYNKGVTIDYEYVIKNNVVAVYIYSYVPTDGTTAPMSGDGLFTRNYFYDIENDKVLKLSEAAKKMAIPIASDQKYEDFGQCSGMIIENGKVTLSIQMSDCH